MRLTTKQINDTFTASIFRQSEQLFRAQERLATQKRINRPSDDPVGLGKVLNYRTALSAVAQYRANIEQAKTHLATGETILGMVDDLMVEAKGVASDQIGASGDETRRTLAAEQVATIRDQLFDLANSKLGNSYLFAGRATDSPPFVRAGDGTISYDGDASADSDKRYRIGEGITVGVEANGETIFSGAEDVFALLQDLHDELQLAAPDTGVIADIQARLQGAIDQVRAVRADNGAVYQRLEATDGQLKRLQLNLDNLRGRQEDLDTAQAAIELKALETNYQVLLATAAKIIQPTLVDFL